MDNLIPISFLNDFVFCPYSIYLHNVYVGTEEQLIHALPQVKGKDYHKNIDQKKYQGKNWLLGLPVASMELGVKGVIDIYRPSERILIERKYQLRNLYRGQILQLWAQYYCLTEMGYEVSKLEFQTKNNNESRSIELPGPPQKNELIYFISTIRHFDPESVFETNPNKCRNCIYINLCHKTNL